MLHIIRSIFRSFAADVPWLLRCTNVKQRSDLRQIQSLRQKVLCRRDVPFDSIRLVVGCSCSIHFAWDYQFEELEKLWTEPPSTWNSIVTCTKSQIVAIFFEASSECFQPFTSFIYLQLRNVGYEYLTEKNGKAITANNRWLISTYINTLSKKPQ